MSPNSCPIRHRPSLSGRFKFGLTPSVEASTYVAAVGEEEGVRLLRFEAEERGQNGQDEAMQVRARRVGADRFH